MSNISCDETFLLQYPFPIASHGFPKIHAALINHGFEGTRRSTGRMAMRIHQPPTRSDKVSTKVPSASTQNSSTKPLSTEGHLIQVVEKGIVEGKNMP